MPAGTAIERLVRFFLDAKLTVVLVLVAAVFGLVAFIATPREENPHIEVPYAVVTTTYDGHSREETERLVTVPLERALEQIPSVEHRYETTSTGRSVITVRYRVGTQADVAFVDLTTRLTNVQSSLPAGAGVPAVQRLDVDDVPVVVLTLASRDPDDVRLRALAQQVADRVAPVSGVGAVTLYGGRAPVGRVDVVPERLAALGLSLGTIADTLGHTDMTRDAGFTSDGQRRDEIRVGAPLNTIADLSNAVLPVGGNATVRLRDLATVHSGAASRTSYHEYATRGGDVQTAVSIAVAKRPGYNVATVAAAVIAAAHAVLLPADVSLHVTRNDGAKAAAAVNGLFERLAEAIVIVSILLLIALGWREALVVALTIPLTLSITLAAAMLLHQTINRITLFALILALGLLVDDAIVVIENIHRMHGADRDRRTSIVRAVAQVASPTILATVTVVLAFLPMGFVTGLMGPYMRPIPVDVPIAMVASLAVALIVTPWAAYRFIPARKRARKESGDVWRQRFAAVVGRLIDDRRRRRWFYGALVTALLVAFALPVMTAVRFRMLPSQNENTFLVTLDMPAGTDLDRTQAVAAMLTHRLLADPNVHDVELFAGQHAVPDFNALLQGLFFRDQGWQADLRVNLIDAHDRAIASDALVRKLRPELARVASPYGALVKLTEEPPGPPVRATVLAEVSGPDPAIRAQLAQRVATLVRAEPQVVDVDTTVKATAPNVFVAVDPLRAALYGINPDEVARELQAAFAGLPVATVRDRRSADPVSVILRYADARRRDPSVLSSIELAGRDGTRIPLASVARFVPSLEERSTSREDGRAVEYVTAEMSGRSSTYAVIHLLLALARTGVPAGYDVKWDGEWQLTLDVFRDLGLAMAVALVLIYMLLVARLRSFRVPLVILSSVPLGLIGVLPGFALLAPHGVYFSATAMIGVIALAGIVVRNSIVLVEFIEEQLAHGAPLREAVITAAAVRARPIALTALAGMLSSAVIAADPVWSGLAWALIFGMSTSAVLSLIVVPLLYARVMRAAPVGQHKPRELPPPHAPAPPATLAPAQ